MSEAVKTVGEQIRRFLVGRGFRRSPGRAVRSDHPFSVTRASFDRHPTATSLALIGLPAAVLLAVFDLPPIKLHGPLHYLGIMGPTCGLTRAVMWFTRGELGRAWQYNPASFLVVPATVAAVVRGAYGWLTSRWLNFSVGRTRWMVLLVAAAVVALTIRQQFYADLLA